VFAPAVPNPAGVGCAPGAHRHGKDVPNLPQARNSGGKLPSIDAFGPPQASAREIRKRPSQAGSLHVELTGPLGRYVRWSTWPSRCGLFRLFSGGLFPNLCASQRGRALQAVVWSLYRYNAYQLACTVQQSCRGIPGASGINDRAPLSSCCVSFLARWELKTRS